MAALFLWQSPQTVARRAGSHLRAAMLTAVTPPVLAQMTRVKQELVRVVERSLALAELAQVLPLRPPPDLELAQMTEVKQEVWCLLVAPLGWRQCRPLVRRERAVH